MRNWFVFSGVHGCGKSTLAKAIVTARPETSILIKKLETPQGHDLFEREKIKICRYTLMDAEAVELAEKSPDKNVFSDRWHKDNLAYFNGFHKLGWLTISEKSKLEYLTESLKYKESPHVIYLDPPSEFVIKNIKKRWVETNKVKYQEDNFEYMDAVRISFQEMYSKQNEDILKITATDLDQRLNLCLEYIDRHRFRRI